MLAERGWAELCPTQVAYSTAIFTYVVILIIITQGTTLDGSLKAICFYPAADCSRLQSAQVTPHQG